MNDIEFSKLLMDLGVLHRYAVFTNTSAIGVYYGQPQILRYLKEHGECSQTEIAKYLNVSSASTAVSIKRMQKSGMLEKKADDSDLRYNKIKITPLGLEKEQKSREIFDECSKKLVSGFSDEEKIQLKNYFERMIENLTENGKTADDVIGELKKAELRSGKNDK